jgi:O-acetyl-ADP-ribose deacetylase (regulator of RNase III)
MGIMRDRLTRYHLKQTDKDAEEAHNRISEEILRSREFTSQSIAEFHASDIVKASRIPSLNDLYRFGHLSRVPTNSKANLAANDIICLIRHDITRLEVDAIVNSTDRAFSGSGSLDKAIFKAGGPDMRKAISKFGICKRGSVKLTEGYQLPCKYVYHTIPPRHYQARWSNARAFRKCYSDSLEMALEIAARTIAFPAIGRGLLGYPRFEAAIIAIEEVQKFLAQHKTGVIDKIIFCVFEETDESTYRILLP